MSDNQTSSLFIESIEEALKEAVKQMGGAKIVGARMRPEMLADEAGRWLSDCLNPEKRDKLSLSQVMWILREARKMGVHVAINFICADSGYDTPRPIEPEDEKMRLQREFIEATQQQTRNIERLSQLMSQPIKAVA